MGGSIFFLPSVNLFKAVSWLFIIGSVLFLIGAMINSVQIIEAPNLQAATISNMTAVSFIGSLLFLVASVPYLWDENDERDEIELSTFQANQFIAGSVFYFLGGIVNYYR